MFGKFVTMFSPRRGCWGSLAISLLALAEARTRVADAVVRGRIALGILSFSIGYSFAVSWPLFENLAFPGSRGLRGCPVRAGLEVTATAIGGCRVGGRRYSLLGVSQGRGAVLVGTLAGT